MREPADSSYRRSIPVEKVPESTLPPRPPQSRLSMVARVLGVLLAALILWFAFRDVDVGQVRALLGALGPLALVVPLPQLVSFSCETLGWRWAFRRLGRRVRFLPLLRVRLTTDALTHSLPGGVVFCESVAFVLLKRHCGVPYPQALVGLAARKVLLLVSQSVYVALIFLFGFSYLQAGSRRFIGTTGLEWVVLGIAAVLALASYAVSATLNRGSVVGKVHTWLSRFPVRRWQLYLAQRRDRFSECDGQMTRFFSAGPHRQAAPVLAFLAGWTSESVETYLILHLLGVDLSFVAVASFEVVLAFVRHTLVFLPAGLGVQDAGYAAFLAALGVPQPLATGAAFVLLKRAKEVLWASVGYAFLLSDRKRVQVAEAELVGEGEFHPHAG
jgi:uncharacterized protein (TIRG00374 family)